MSEIIDTPKIVVGYDGSDASRRGLERALQLGTLGAQFLVVAVTPDVRSPGLASRLTGDAFDGQGLLEEAQVLLESPDGLAIETRAVTGDPAEVLVQVAGEVGAGLLIVGRRGGDFVTRTLLGSVAQRVAQGAPCDVLIVT